MKIRVALRGDTADYSAEELKKYITAMTRGAIVPEILHEESLPEKAGEGEILLGLLDELKLDASDLEDAFIEDIIDIDIQNGTGYIAGSNPRSILMGVYKYCTSAGCRFIRPGEGGDYVPKADIANHSFKYRKKADRDFRGECSEGAISYEHMRDTVYWLPKIGMNMYMIEGFVPYTYMHKWYGHVGNDKLRIKGQCTDYKMLEEYMDLLERDIKRTGIQLHTLGHAWMTERLGIQNDCPAKVTAALEKLTEEQMQYFALVNGKRGLFHNDPFFTEFCYSNPAARKFLVESVLAYIRKKPHVDFVHLWLADAINNHCECDECRKMIPSDYYVMLMNEMDEALEKIGSDTRIVFIMYTETAFPPEKIRLKNPKRFTLLTAIGSNYENGYLIERYQGEMPKYERNNYVTPDAPVRLRMYDEWQKWCGNIPSIIYEYRFYTDMYHDLGNMRISRETHRDMRSLEKVPFDGCMSDQTHRMYMPTALPLITMGQTLFDKSTDFDQLADEYFAGAFGEDGARCRAYLEKLSELLCVSNFRIGGKKGMEELGIGDNSAAPNKRIWINNPYVAEKVKEIPAHLAEFLPVIEHNIAAAQDPAQRMSWVYLRHHSAICAAVAKIMLAGAENNLDKAAEICRSELFPYLSEHELEFHNVFDLFLFRRFISLKVGLPLPQYFA